MMRKLQILSLIFVFGFAFCLMNGFADDNGGVADANLIPVENFDFPTADGAAYIQGNAEFQRSLDNIIGTPDFEKMRDLPSNSQDYQLGRKVGMIAIPQRSNPERFWICTGFLVGPDLFMTNHHCIHDDFGLLPLSNVRVYMDYYQEPDVDPTRGGVTARVSSILRMDAVKDYALLRLDSPIGNTYGWLELDTTTGINSSQSVKLMSHNEGRSKEIVRRNTEIVDIPAGHPWRDVPFAFLYLADAERGSSGSPVLLRDGTGVIGIHHSAWTFNGDPVFNGGTLMTYIVPEIQQWLPGEAPTPPTSPDLVVESPQISSRYLGPGESFTVSATVRNQGAAALTATMLRFYQSLDNSITSSDIEVGTTFIDPLTSGGSSQASITLTAPVSLGTYYYGACVDPLTDEGNPNNNCSASVTLTVSTTPVPAANPMMYWTDESTGKIQRANLDGSNVQDLLTQSDGLEEPTGIALDVQGGKMYWTDTDADKIQRANLDGSNIENLVTRLGHPQNLALDISGGKMYWADWVYGYIQRANLDGSNFEEDLVHGLSDPYGIAVDGAGGKIYWTDWDTSKIQRANLDGSNVEDLLTASDRLEWPRGITLDVAGGKMYWTDNLADEISRANLDGSNVQILVTRSDGLSDPKDIALDVAGGKMYWTDGRTGKIQRANLDGSSIEDLVTGLSDPHSIALGIPQTPQTITFQPSTIADQTFTVGRAVSLTLPTAIGGTPPYIYTLAPPLPAGLYFDPIGNGPGSIGGTPTVTLPPTPFTYTATDTTGAAAALTFNIEVTGTGPDPLDVNGDGQVDVLDLVLVAVFYGTRGNGLPADVNADGIVNVQDFAAVAAGVDAAGAFSLQVIEAVLLAAIEQAGDLEQAAEAPRRLNTPSEVLSVSIVYGNVAEAFVDTRRMAVTDARLTEAVALLKTLLALLTEMGAIPETTALLPNYPNPFNPETWIPYHLAADAEVIVTIYDVRGSAVRVLRLGHQSAGVYHSKHRAAYWDGRNQSGEKVASGVYFFTLTAGDFSATRKMLIAK